MCLILVILQNYSNVCDFCYFTEMMNCVTYKSVALMKAIISFTLLTIISTLCAFILDLIGPSKRSLKLLRRNAIFNIVSGEYLNIKNQKIKVFVFLVHMGQSLK